MVDMEITRRFPINMIKKGKILFLIIISSITLMLILNKPDRKMSIENSQKVFKLLKKSLQIDTPKFKGPPRNESKIFFIETSFTSEDGFVSLTSRQACAIESAALKNPNSTIYVYIVTRNSLNFDKKLVSDTVNELFYYKNVKFVFVELSSYFRGSPVEDLYTSGMLESSLYFTSHLSDVLRYLTLWRYNGIYLDMDMIVQMPLDGIPPNFVCAESYNLINGALMSLSGKTGKKFGRLFLRDINKNFNGIEWASNGPSLITRVLSEVCGTEYTFEMTSTVCKGFRVLPIEYCYSIPWEEYEKFFLKKYSKSTMRRVRYSLVVHFWNNLSHKFKLKVNSKAAYINLAKNFCPKVYKICDEYF